jgi:aspartate racemase
MHKIIYDELCMGLVRDASRAEYRRIIQRLVDQGAQGVILGCTEISMLVGPSDSPVPIFDTTSIHARKAAEWALSEEGNPTGQI